MCLSEGQGSFKQWDTKRTTASYNEQLSVSPHDELAETKKDIETERQTECKKARQ